MYGDAGVRGTPVDGDLGPAERSGNVGNRPRARVQVEHRPVPLSQACRAPTFEGETGTCRGAPSLGVAAKRRLITYSPATVVTPPTERNKSGTAWTPAEAAKFLDAVAEHRLYAAWHLVLIGGARRSEIAGATWELLDLDTGVWYVQNAHVQVGGTVHAKQPKSAAGLRTVYLDEETVAVLRAHRAQQTKERLAAGPRWVDSGHVFTTRTGAPIPPDRLTTAWRTLATKSGLPIIRLHDGRHTSNTTASVYAGVGDQVLIERVGHAGLDVNRRYRHAHEQVHRQAAEAIAAEYRQHRRNGDPGTSSQSG